MVDEYLAFQSYKGAENRRYVAQIKITKSLASYEFVRTLWLAGYEDQTDLAAAYDTLRPYVSRATRGELPSLRHDLLEYMKIHPKH